MSIRLFVHMEQLASYRADFHEIWYLKISRETVDKKKHVWLQHDKNNRYFIWRPMKIEDSIWLYP